MFTATAAAAGATGARAWLAARLGPRALRLATAGLLGAAGLVAAGVLA